MFHGLKWLHNYVPNWGWAVVVLTLVINTLFFPLRISSYKTTVKMQRVAPEIKAIQERYKKYKFNDPKKAEMNKEVMAVYQREGINIGGGGFCSFFVKVVLVWPVTGQGGGLQNQAGPELVGSGPFMNGALYTFTLAL